MQALEQRVEPFTPVRIGDLVIDDTYQRGPQIGFIESLVENWDDRYLQPIEVNVRPNGLRVVMDGGQRFRAALVRFGENHELMARIHYYRTVAEEATHFRALDHRQPLKPYNIAKVALAMGDPVYVEIETILGRYGKRLYVGDGHDQTHVKAITATVRSHQMYGPEALDRAFGVLADAYSNNDEGFTQYFIRAMTRMAYEHPGIDFGELAERIRGYGPGGVLSRASLKKAANRVSDREAMFLALKDIYNERRRTKRI